MTKGTILVVEDTLESLKLLTDLLIAEGYQVRPANSGELALGFVAAFRPDLILLDLRMPGMDGFEVLRRLKAQELSRDIPVIVLSAVTETERRVEGLKLGAVDFVHKPFQREELLARVQLHTELARARSRLVQQAADLKETNKQLQIEIVERKHVEEDLRLAKQATLSRVKRLEGLLSICMQCKKIRTENNDWHQLEQYIGEHSDAVFSHGLCPDCLEKAMKKLD